MLGGKNLIWNQDELSSSHKFGEQTFPRQLSELLGQIYL
jgi:hypothetical protein